MNLEGLCFEKNGMIFRAVSATVETSNYDHEGPQFCRASIVLEGWRKIGIEPDALSGAVKLIEEEADNGEYPEPE